MLSTIGNALFKNIGKKIKALATVLFIIASTLEMVFGIYLIFAEESSSFMRVVGLLIAMIGPILSWASQFLLYGFGELIDKEGNGREAAPAPKKKYNDAFLEEEEAFELIKDETTDEDVEFFDPTKEN